MASINIANGNPNQTFDVADLSDEQIATALEFAALASDLADRASGETDREWLDSFCELHVAEHGTVFTLP